MISLLQLNQQSGVIIFFNSTLLKEIVVFKLSTESNRKAYR
jgi:hypothetical protein